MPREQAVGISKLGGMGPLRNRGYLVRNFLIEKACSTLSNFYKTKNAFEINMLHVIVLIHVMKNFSFCSYIESVDATTFR